MLEFLSTIIALGICVGTILVPVVLLIVFIRFISKKSKLNGKSTTTFYELEDIENDLEKIEGMMSRLPKSFGSYNIDNGQWNNVKQRVSFNKDALYWIDKLKIPYKRQILDVKQCEDEIIRLYVDLVKVVDTYLRKRGNKLENLIKEIDESEGYYSYSNILYTIECVAEGEVEKFYRGDRGYDNSFSFELLQKNIDSNISSYIDKYLKDRLKDISPPNLDTIQQLGLSKNGLPYQWWDPEGIIREKLGISKSDYKWLQRLGRDTKFLGISQCRTQTIKLYLHLINQLNKHYIDNKNLNRNTLLIFRKSYLDDWKSRKTISVFLRDVHKLAENTIRTEYRFNRLLNTNDSVSRIKEHIGEERTLWFLHEIEAFRSSIEKPTKTTLRELADMNPCLWKTEIKKIKDTISKENVLKMYKLSKELIDRFAETERILETHYELAKIFSKYNKIIALFFFAKYHQISKTSQKTTKTLPSNIQNELFSNQQQVRLYSEITDRRYTDRELLEKIKKLFIPKRRTVNIDKDKIKDISILHERTVQRLTKYLEEEDTELKRKEITDDTSRDITKLEDVFSTEIPTGSVKESLNQLQLDLLRLFQQNNFYLDHDLILKFAQVNNLFANSLIDRINQIFYDRYKDTPLIEHNNGYQIDKEYISIIKKINNE